MKKGKHHTSGPVKYLYTRYRIYVLSRIYSLSGGRRIIPDDKRLPARLSTCPNRMEQSDNELFKPSSTIRSHSTFLVETGLLLITAVILLLYLRQWKAALHDG